MDSKLPMLDPIELTKMDEGPLDFKGFATDSACEPIAGGVLVPTIFHGKKKPRLIAAAGAGLSGTLLSNICLAAIQADAFNCKCSTPANLH